MTLEIKNDLLFIDGLQVPFYDTPNKSGKTMKPTYLVEHFTGDNSPKSTIGWFMDKNAAASAHLLIDREGNIYQFGKFNMVLWHAGKSTWDGIIGMNSHSIGIEFTNLGKTVKRDDSVLLKYKDETKSTYWQSYTDKQIEAGAQISQFLKNFYSLKEIIGHEDIAPGRKIDPGAAFPWKIIRGEESLPNNLKTTSDLNLRSGYGTNFPVIVVIPKGQYVTELSREGDWSSVIFNGVKGFVSNKYLIK